MTIFLMVLKKLIKEQLGLLAVALSSQITPQGTLALISQITNCGYNRKLSLEQKEKVEQLDAAIVGFVGTDNDEMDYQELIKIIDAIRREIGTIRETHGKPAASGNTVQSLTDLSDHVKSFYFKLSDCKFKLLDRQYTVTPENITYFHACYYFGEDIFSPLLNLDVEIRKNKEIALIGRLQQLSELIKPNFGLADQKSRTLKLLKDLATDNRDIVKKTGSTNVPGLSFWGIGLTAPNDWFSPSEGRFAVHFASAVTKVNDMTEADFVPNDAYDSEQKHASVE